MQPKIAIVAALPREIAELVRGWKNESRPKKKIFIYTRGCAVVACAGMGARRAELAVRAALEYGPVGQILSVGWAGALRYGITAGAVLQPASVIDAVTGERFSCDSGKGTLVTAAQVADAEQKDILAAQFNADCVDMEAAAVARIAAQHGIPFRAVKAISDARDAKLPPLQMFTTDDGWFRETTFAAYIAARPWLWPGVLRMAVHSSRAAQNLCRELRRMLQTYAAERSGSVGSKVNP
jgi:adenosylhomocysteine nucleosidase